MEDSDVISYESLSKLRNLSDEELQKLEENISTEFKELSYGYIQSRLSRINFILSSINETIKAYSESDIRWQKRISEETGTLSRIKSYSEDCLLNKKGGSTATNDRRFSELESEIKDIRKDILYPSGDTNGLKFETLPKETLSLPFQQELKKIVQPFENEVKFILNESKYRLNMLNETAKANLGICWKQYFSDLHSCKNSMINKTYEHLNRLYEEFNHINYPEILKKDADNYYRSVMPVGLGKRSYSGRDFVLDTEQERPFVLNKKNKVQLTDTKYRILLKQKGHISVSSSNSGTGGLVRQLALGCTGLSKSEVEQDLLALRAGLKPTIGQEEEASDKDVEESTSVSSVDNGDRDEENEGKSVYENRSEENLSERNLYQKYRYILAIQNNENSEATSLGSSPESSFVAGTRAPKLNIPELPPLQSFVDSRLSSL